MHWIKMILLGIFLFFSDFPIYASDHLILLSKEDLKSCAFLVSYGGSGNTWLRYNLEFLTKRPTLKFKAEYRTYDAIPLDTITKHMKLPINNAIPLGVDYAKPPIFKAHLFYKESPYKKIDENIESKLILLIRNPKECVLRHSNAGYDLACQRLGNPNFSFYGNIKCFDAWNPKTKMIVYYEDLIKYPEKTLKELLKFLGEDKKFLSDFMKNFEFHKKQSLEFYEFTLHKSKTKGKETIFYLNKISDEEKKVLDEIIEKTHPIFWKKYLMRYAEA